MGKRTTPKASTRENKIKFSHLRYRLIILTRFLTIRRVSNLLLNQWEYLFRKARLRSLPRSLSLELTNICNLRCPSCPTHTQSSSRKRKIVTYRQFAYLVRKFKGFMYNFAIGANGEITIIPGIEKYVSLGRKNNLFITADTNLNCSRETIKKLFLAGINMVNISLDGTSQRSYGRYRIGGNFKRVFENMAYLVKLKRKNKSFFPIVQWQLIVNKFNESEVEKARKMAIQVGIDQFRTGLPFIPGGDDYFFGDNPKIVEQFSRRFLPTGSQYQIKDRVALLACYQPFSELQILNNGDVIPCCRLREKGVVLGNIFKKPLIRIWNNAGFIYFRRQLKKQGRRPHCAVCLKNMTDWQKKK
ncbi:MAG: SPASM domain-containing protein [Candidatus Pacebacteria bacterium]|nr:SPASM domain-containing protein [Candidatus Paceibacterota bacterium]